MEINDVKADELGIDLGGIIRFSNSKVIKAI